MHDDDILHAIDKLQNDLRALLAQLAPLKSVGAQTLVEVAWMVRDVADLRDLRVAENKGPQVSAPGWSIPIGDEVDY